MKLPVRCSAHARGSRLKAKAGFTLVEVMVAVGVLAQNPGHKSDD